MPEAFICDGVRTPIGRYAGGLAKVRTDDLGAIPIKALMQRHPKVDWNALDEVYFGCANQAGEDNRNVARIALLLAGLPESIPGITINRLCSSGLNAVGLAAQGIRAGEIDFAIAGGVESMTRAPLVMGKAQEAFQRSAQVEDTTIGWRFINPLMKQQYGVDAMPETAENVAEDYPGRAQGPGRLCAALAAARREGARRGIFCRRDRAGGSAGRQGRPDHGEQ
jgi:3-oxoadipyl-CoA thiolase